MSSPLIVCFFGLSNAGKTTLAKALSNYDGSPYITPITPLKQFLETTFELEEGSLDTQEGKEEVFGKGVTMGQVLRDLYHFWQPRADIGKQMLKKQLQDLRKHNNLIFVDSIRNGAEVRELNKYAPNLLGFVIHRKGSILHTTDAQLDNNLDQFAGELYDVENSKPIHEIVEELAQTVDIYLPNELQ